MKTARALGALLAVSLASSAQAGYNIEVQSATGFPDSETLIAVLPAKCPADVDCVWLNKRMESELAERPHIKIVPMKTLNQLMFDKSITEINAESANILAAELHIDAFLIVSIGHSGTESSGNAIAIPVGNSFMMAQSQVASGNLDINIFAAADGKLLMKGSGFGESGFRRGKGVLLELFVKILDKAFPRPR